MDPSGLRSLIVATTLVWMACGSSKGGSPNGGGGSEGGSSGGAQQAGTNGGGSAGAGVNAGAPGAGAGAIAGSAASGAGTSGAAEAGSDGGGAGGSRGGSASDGGNATAETFGCGTLTCRSGEQFCHRNLPALPGGTEQRTCEAFPEGCAAADCSCFCGAGKVAPCQGPTGCTCSGAEGQVQLTCAGA